jgi:hypothetical protein
MLLGRCAVTDPGDLDWISLHRQDGQLGGTYGLAQLYPSPGKSRSLRLWLERQAEIAEDPVAERQADSRAD